MWRVVALCWVFIAPVVAGILIMVVIMTPAFAANAGAWIVRAAALGAILGVPAAFVFVKTQVRGLPQ